MVVCYSGPRKLTATSLHPHNSQWYTLSPHFTDKTSELRESKLLLQDEILPGAGVRSGLLEGTALVCFALIFKTASEETLPQTSVYLRGCLKKFLQLFLDTLTQNLWVGAIWGSEGFESFQVNLMQGYI